MFQALLTHWIGAQREKQRTNDTEFLDSVFKVAQIAKHTCQIALAIDVMNDLVGMITTRVVMCCDLIALRQFSKFTHSR